jgi:hypothetical protein
MARLDVCLLLAVAARQLHLEEFAQFSQDSHKFKAETYSDYLMDTATGGF